MAPTPAQGALRAALVHRPQHWLLAAVSGVTGLAIDMAQGCGVTLLGFARGPDLNVYSHSQHIRF